ncbi:MAG: acetate--CoA ligase family protein [Hyphomicrobiales bacterium]
MTSRTSPTWAASHFGLRTPQEARHAAERMLARARELCPDAHLQGFTIQPMVMRKQAHELSWVSTRTSCSD